MNRSAATSLSLGQTNPPLPTYHIYAGNLHAHTLYTWSHGGQYDKNKTLRPDWQKHQGPPSAHFALAKANGYDFYAVTDHSQEVAFRPTSPTNAAWLATKREATENTDRNFVAIAGYEHSKNNGPKGTGHLNVFNSAEYLDALAPVCGNDNHGFLPRLTL